MDIQNLTNSINIKYMCNLLYELNNKKSGYDSDDYKDKVEFIEKLKKDTKLSDTTSSETENRQMYYKSNLDNELLISPTKNENTDSNIEFSDDYLYKKPWTKLAAIHKIIKVKEFVQKLIINKNEDREKLKDSLITLVNNKKLTKKDMVKYDSVNGRIIGIPNLKYSNGRYHIIL
jgi:hypothetical protein